ncbi:MAG: CBS domain-containing protein [Gammaproteobacteria bacterium]|jgi:CBS domain-containing protein
MKLVSQLLTSKGHDVWSIAPDTTVLNALQLMADKKIGALLVLDEDKLVGVFSERDYARKVVLKGKSSKDTSVGDVMSSNIVRVVPDQTTELCMNLMTEKRVRHLPVVDGDKVIGVISIGDVVKAVIADREDVIEQLEQYIAGTF